MVKRLIGTGFMGTQLNGYLVLQGSKPLRTSHLKHIIILVARTRLGTSWAKCTRVAGAELNAHCNIAPTAQIHAASNHCSPCASTLTQWNRTPRPQLGPQITILDKCNINEFNYITNTSLLISGVGVGGFYAIGVFFCAHVLHTLVGCTPVCSGLSHGLISTRG